MGTLLSEQKMAEIFGWRGGGDIDTMTL